MHYGRYPFRSGVYEFEPDSAFSPVVVKRRVDASGLSTWSRAIGVVPEYVDVIEDAARDIRGWYAKQLGGPTFHLADPIVEVLHSDKRAAWFTTHPNGNDEASWGFCNTLDEMRRLRDVRPIRDNSIWVVYSDGPGNKGRAIPGFAYLPEDDLLGLVGKHPTQKDPVRWVAGMGHELGHALGLPHPRDTKKHYDALMWAGFYGKYPDRWYLTDEDKAILAKNPFIVASAELNLVPKPHLVKSLEGQPWRLDAAMRVRVPEQIPKAREHFRVVAGALKMLANSDIRFVDEAEEADLVVVAEPALPPDAYPSASGRPTGFGSRLRRLRASPTRPRHCFNSSANPGARPFPPKRFRTILTAPIVTS